MRGVDHPAGPAPGFVVADSATLPCIVVRGKALAHLPFAELKAIAQHVAEGLGRRTAGIARELLEAALLSLAEHEGAHAGKSSIATSDLCFQRNGLRE